MKHGCVIPADAYHPTLAAIVGLLEGILNTVVMVSSVETLLEAAQRINDQHNMMCPTSGDLSRTLDDLKVNLAKGGHGYNRAQTIRVSKP